MSEPVHARFPDGRLHLQHGPIDCIVEAWGERAEVEAAYSQAVMRFQDILPVLVTELALLRATVGSIRPAPLGPVAHRMVAAVWPHRDLFITPMAAVAGAVADDLLEALVLGRKLDKAHVNDGGDIALHLNAPHEFDVGIADDPHMRALAGSLRLNARSPIRGIATSGWRGRSQSLGIADAVTVLARSAASADAAATLIANAVNLDHPAIRRLPARAVKEDSDLGDLLVTVEVGALPRQAVEEALESGAALARSFRDRNLIEGAFLCLDGQCRTVQDGAFATLAVPC